MIQFLGLKIQKLLLAISENNQLFVSIGSLSNVSVELLPRASVQVMNLVSSQTTAKVAAACEMSTRRGLRLGCYPVPLGRGGCQQEYIKLRQGDLLKLDEMRSLFNSTEDYRSFVEDGTISEKSIQHLTFEE